MRLVPLKSYSIAFVGFALAALGSAVLEAWGLPEEPGPSLVIPLWAAAVAHGCFAATFLYLAFVRQVEADDQAVCFRGWRGTVCLAWNDISDYYLDRDRLSSHAEILVLESDNARIRLKSADWRNVREFKQWVQEHAGQARIRQWGTLGARPVDSPDQAFSVPRRVPMAVFLLTGLYVPLAILVIVYFVSGLLDPTVSQQQPNWMPGIVALIVMLELYLFVRMLWSGLRLWACTRHQFVTTPTELVYRSPGQERRNPYHQLRLVIGWNGFVSEVVMGDGLPPVEILAYLNRVRVFQEILLSRGASRSGAITAPSRDEIVGLRENGSAEPD